MPSPVPTTAIQIPSPLVHWQGFQPTSAVFLWKQRLWIDKNIFYYIENFNYGRWNRTASSLKTVKPRTLLQAVYRTFFQECLGRNRHWKWSSKHTRRKMGRQLLNSRQHQPLAAVTRLLLRQKRRSARWRHKIIIANSTHPLVVGDQPVFIKLYRSTTAGEKHCNESMCKMTNIKHLNSMTSKSQE